MANLGYNFGEALRGVSCRYTYTVNIAPPTAIIQTTQIICSYLDAELSSLPFRPAKTKQNWGSNQDLALETNP